MKQTFCKRATTLMMGMALVALMPMSVLHAGTEAVVEPSKEIKPVKNVIIMISDGTSLPCVSLARWYQRTVDNTKQHLNIDPYLCGTLLTYCSDAPIGDSAPTTSTYMTGIPSIQGFVATHPYSVPGQDLVPVDSTWQYRPIMTLMEATKIYDGRRTGVVVTCEFPHATPADCLAHSYRRSKYEWIVPQMVYSGVDVLIGGGVQLMKPEYDTYLTGAGYKVLKNDLDGMRSYNGGKLWALFHNMDLPYDLDRDPAVTPSLAEMTDAAIRNLDNEKGFFLMVEGSKVDWGAHANDPVAMATEFIAFDKALKVALDFAKKDGNTVVIVTSDHGNSGMSIGMQSLNDYAGASQQKLFGDLVKVQKTADGLAAILQETPYKDAPAVYEKYTGFKMTEAQHEALRYVKGYKQSDIPDDQRGYNKGEEVLYANSIAAFMANLLRSNMYFGFTTHGHTGEEVFLAIAAPDHTPRMMGFNTNIQLYEYMRSLLDVSGDTKSLSDKHYAPHTSVFSGLKWTISGNKPEEKILTVKGKGKTLTIPAFRSVYRLGKKEVTTTTPAVYVDKTNLFYVDSSLINHFK